MKINILNSKVPLFMEVKNILFKEISSGDLGDTGKLPSEEILATRYGVSMATIGSVLQSLEKDGIVTSQQGIGTFISSKSLQLKLQIDEAKGFFQLIRDSGHKPSIHQTSISILEASSRLSRLLDIAPKQQLLLYERLFLGDGEPVIFVAEYTPMNCLIKVPEVKEIPKSIYQFADNFCHETIEYSISEIIPEKANKKLEKKMNLKQSEMFLKLKELHFGKQNRPIIFSDVYVRDSMIRFQVVCKKPLI